MAAIVVCSIVVVAVTDVVKLLIRKGERERARERESNREIAGVETHKARKQKGERTKEKSKRNKEKNKEDKQRRKEKQKRQK